MKMAVRCNMRFPNLPPLVGDMVDGQVGWITLSDKDYSTIGYFLCCHLVIENYLEAYIQSEMKGQFSIYSAKLRFGQKLNLIENIPLPERYNFIPALKHFNGLRNKLSHNIHTEMNEDNLSPLVQFVEKAREEPLIKRDAINIIQNFTGFVCSWLAGCYMHQKKGESMDKREEFERWVVAHDSKWSMTNEDGN